MALNTITLALAHALALAASPPSLSECAAVACGEFGRTRELGLAGECLRAAVAASRRGQLSRVPISASPPLWWCESRANAQASAQFPHSFGAVTRILLCSRSVPQSC